MADYPNQDPRWPSKAHFEPVITNRGKFSGLPRCQSYKTDRSAQCEKPSSNGYRVCETHGAKGAKANQALQDRKQFLDVLGANDGESIRAIIAKLHEIALSGNLDAIKYILDQLYGAPKSTVVTEISDRDAMARMVRVTAKHLQGEAFEAWLSDLEIEMRGDSESKTSASSPEQ